MRKRFELMKDGEIWGLFDQLGERVLVFQTKAEALAGGVIEKLVENGTVRIRGEDGQFERDLSFPQWEYPRGR